MLDKIFQIVLYKGLTVGRALKYSIIAFVLFNLSAFTWHLHKDMGGIALGLNGYQVFYSNYLKGHFRTYTSIEYPIHRKFLLSESEWHSALLGYKRDLPPLDLRAPLCDLKSMMDELHKEKKCKIATPGSGFTRTFCDFSPNCRGIGLARYVWDAKEMRNEILDAAFNPCRYLPDREAFKAHKNIAIRNMELLSKKKVSEYNREDHDLYRDGNHNTAKSNIFWNGCLTPLPPITRIAVTVFGPEYRATQKKEDRSLYIASLNRKTNEITIQSGDE